MAEPLKLYCHPDRHDAILTRHLPRLVETLGSEARWWFLRYHDPDHHLRIRLTVPDHTSADAAAEVTAWSEQVRQAGLTSRVQWDTYFPETARFGGPSAMDAAEAHFAADSATVVAQLTAIITRRGPHLHALTAASLLDMDTVAPARHRRHARPDLPRRHPDGLT
nr:thiopeptide-type bacteriocin biosynthesis protein [Nonomuraea diastatica]